ncbi:hypothetical protein ElyMa_002614300 [Elysia marginata]|uniref:Uncharacterized protein n=1 Tax=Elysia marginata TaxID=1093978 RepID=A0AAV4H6L0_9GAST|nr:hypothetical protein ElyMa_002614300 [Elysia marginata]
MVHQQKRFEEVKVHFPTRGHSCMECDQDMVCVKQKLHVKTPGGWWSHFAEARRKPSRFEVINVTQLMLVNVKKSLVKIFYYASCSFKVLGIREIIFSRDHPRLMKYRENWNGPFLSGVVTQAVSETSPMVRPPLEPMHNTPLPLSKKKYDDLQQIRSFDCPQSHRTMSEDCHVREKSRMETTTLKSVMRAKVQTRIRNDLCKFFQKY